MTIRAGSSLRLGDRCFVNTGVLFDCEASIRIEDDVHIAPRAQLLTSGHVLGGPERRAGDVTTATVEVGAGSWIGAGAVILPGVTIGRGCVIAAGAVVTGDCKPDGLYAGVPAQRKRDLAG